jgi:hypothetical protein
MRIADLTYLSRIKPDLPCTVYFEEEEWGLLYRAANKTDKPPVKPYTIGEAVNYPGRLGGPKRDPSGGRRGCETRQAGLRHRTCRGVFSGKTETQSAVAEPALATPCVPVCTLPILRRRRQRDTSFFTGSRQDSGKTAPGYAVDTAVQGNRMSIYRHSRRCGVRPAGHTLDSTT